MAVFEDIPNETILAIRSFIPHPPDILQFTRVCKRMYSLTVPLLYENITLDDAIYHSSPYRTFRKRWLGEAQPYLAIEKLTNILEDDHKSGRLQLSPNVRTLVLRLPLNIDHTCDVLWPLTKRLTALVDLRVTFEILGRDNPTYERPDCTCSDPTRYLYTPNLSFRQHEFQHLARLQNALKPASTKLKALTILSDTIYVGENAYLIDVLSNSETLEHLDIEGKVLGYYACSTSLDPIADFGTRLPPNLKTLQLRFYSHPVALENLARQASDVTQAYLDEILQVVVLLKKYLKLPERPQASLKKVVIWLPEPANNTQSLRMRALTCVLKEVSTIASQQGINLVIKIVDG